MQLYILFISLVLTSTNLYSQEKNTETTPTKSIVQKSKKPFVYQPHSIGINTRFGVFSRHNVAQNSAIFLFMTTVDFYLGKRLGKTQYIPFLLQVRLSTSAINQYTSYFPLYEQFRWGFLLGASQYAFDNRSKSTGIGWSMMVQGGLAFDLPAGNKLKDPLNSLVALGVELELKGIYNISKHVGFSIGTSLGYHISYGLRNDSVVDDDGFALPVPKGLYLDHVFAWQISAGVIF